MRNFIFAAALPLATASCAQSLPTESVVNFSVADPTVSTSSNAVPAFITGYDARVATGPAPWRGLNDAQAPEVESTN